MLWGSSAAAPQSRVPNHKERNPLLQPVFSTVGRLLPTPLAPSSPKSSGKKEHAPRFRNTAIVPINVKQRGENRAEHRHPNEEQPLSKTRSNHRSTRRLIVPTITINLNEGWDFWKVIDQPVEVLRERCNVLSREHFLAEHRD